VALTRDKKTYLKQQTIFDRATVLDLRRCSAVSTFDTMNLERVAKIEAYTKDSKIAVLRDGTHLSVSRAGYARRWARAGNGFWDTNGSRRVPLAWRQWSPVYKVQGAARH
jgi:hypothetical protein